MKAPSQPKVNSTFHFPEPRKLAKGCSAPGRPRWRWPGAGAGGERGAQPVGPPGSPGSATGRKEGAGLHKRHLTYRWDTATPAGFITPLAGQKYSRYLSGVRCEYRLVSKRASAEAGEGAPAPAFRRWKNKRWKRSVFVRGTSKQNPFEGSVAV